MAYIVREYGTDKVIRIREYETDKAIHKTIKTAVCYRVFDDGDVVALFPNLDADLNGNITSYQHIGQHGAASRDLLTELRAATETEHAELHAELTHRYEDSELEILD